MPQLVPFYFLNEVFFAFIILTIIAYMLRRVGLGMLVKIQLSNNKINRRITLLIPKFYQLIIKKDNFNNSVAFVGIGYSDLRVLNFSIKRRFLYSLKLSQTTSALQLNKQSNTAPTGY